ncbi:DNA polymerase lambda [Mycena crocata]|nr:DNA polymerase lambda [Mycena crocata]
MHTCSNSFFWHRAPLSKKEKPPSKTLPPVKKPPSKRVKPSVRPSVKIPQSPVPVPIDLVSPIEEPDFSVLVSRFEPEATSTQPKLGAEPSAFLQLKERVEKKAMMKREKKIAKASKTGAIVAGPSKAAISGDESIISVSSSSSLPPSPEPNRIVPVKVKQKQKQKQKAAPAEPPKSVKAPPKQKGKTAERVRMYPKDYAQMLKDKSDSSLKPTGKPQFLKGKYIFYTGGDMTWASKSTMKCMDIIVQYGGNICPVFDGSIVTHIVTDASPTTTLRALGVKKTAEIPDHIPVLTWSWVTDSIDDGRPAELFHYAAFSNRIPPASYLANSSKGKGKQRAVAGDESRISAFTQDKKERRRTIHDSEDEDSDADVKPGPGPLASPPPSPKHKARATDASSFRTKSGGKADPLAEFYAQAKKMQARQQGRTRMKSQREIRILAPRQRECGFTCDNKEVQRKNGPNEFILEQLMNLHKAKPGMDDHWRAFSYQKCLRSIRNHPKRIKSFNEARSIRGVGNKTALKIMEIVETGDLRRIGYENTADVQVRAIFQGIYGVGQTTAYKWYAAGCRSIKNLVDGTGGVVLTPAQKIGIQFYDDINDRMPREEAKALFELIKPVALAIDPKLEVQIMGSYRRGKADCGDIDIMITRCPDDGKTHAGILHHLLKALHERKIITEDLALPEDPFDEEAIYRGLCHLPHFGARRRRIDFLCIPWKSRGAALLYYTGDDIFNRAMRYKAGALGYSLNQKGLSAGVVRDPNNRTKKLSAGNVVASETEEEIFRMLDVPFQEPHERVRG